MLLGGNVPEPITTIGLGAIAAYIGKDGLEKLLGPTADYLGGGLKEFTQKRMENIGKIFKNADEKLGHKREQPGIIPPKVLKTIMNDGSFNDDSLAVEYFGGVLASSRTEHGRDDRGARMAKLVDGLSTYQLRTHYLIYSTIKEIFQNKSYLFNMDDRPKMEIFLPFKNYAKAMSFGPEELNNNDAFLRHTFFGLANDGLIENNFLYGSEEHMKKKVPTADDGGIICQPSALGAELFLWALGCGDHGLNYIFSEKCQPSVEGMPNVVVNTIAVIAT
jgi:hypothetical protein